MISYLEKYIKDFKALVNSENVTQSQVYNYYYRFYEIKTKCIKKSNIIEKFLTFKFLYTLLQNLKVKAIRFIVKRTKFNLDNIKTFKKVYTTIKNSYVILKDIDNLI